MPDATESDATTADGSAYRSLTVDKSGGKLRCRDLLPWGGD